MKASSIAHVPVKASALTMLQAQLSESSKKLLGYDPTHVPVFGVLSHALAKLGIEPLNTSDVDRYKRSKEYTSFSNITRAALTLLIVNCLSLISAIALTGHLHWPWADNAKEAVSSANAIMWTTLPIVTLIAWIVFAFWQDDTMRVQVSRTWQRLHLHGFAGYVPEHVIEKAIQIKTEVPDAQFSIDVLQQQETRWAAPRTLRDPFLIVTHGQEWFYVDVWEEPKFERATRLS